MIFELTFRAAFLWNQTFYCRFSRKLSWRPRSCFRRSCIITAVIGFVKAAALKDNAAARAEEAYDFAAATSLVQWVSFGALMD